MSANQNTTIIIQNMTVTSVYPQHDQAFLNRQWDFCLKVAQRSENNRRKSFMKIYQGEDGTYYKFNYYGEYLGIYTRDIPPGRTAPPLTPELLEKIKEAEAG